MSNSLEEIQDALLDRLHAGEPVDQRAVLAEHPEHVEALQQFFKVVALMEEAPMSEEPTPSRLGEFRILREIGRGGMGVVYEAEQASLNRSVALKVLLPALRSDRKLLARFRREAEAAARLRHPNVVPVYSIGESGGVPFFAMEFVEGRSLAELISERNGGGDAGLPTDPGEYRQWAVTTIAKIARALGYAHDRGILHRDVKPANILLETDLTPRLTDFGLALDLEASSLTVAGEVFGSPQYMSPEQACRRDNPLDARTDIYSLGVTLYQLLTLRLPYEGTTTHEILAALASGDIVPPRDADPSIPRALENVVLRALGKDPASRYATAADLAEDLLATLDGRPVAARRRRRRRPMVVTALSILLAGLGVWALLSSLAEGALGVDQVQLLADGTHGDGENAMRRLFQPAVRVRHVIARSGPARCLVDLNYRVGAPNRSGDDLHAIGILEHAVNGGEWQRPPSPRIDIQISGTAGNTGFLYDLKQAVGKALDRNSMTLTNRLTIRLIRHQFALDAPPESELKGGTVCSWIWHDSLFVYDDYPADYPQAVSSPPIDAEMAAVFTPDHVAFVGTTASGAGRKSLSVQLQWQSRPAAPVAIAGEVLMHAPGSDVVIARRPWSSPGTAIRGRMTSQMDFYLAEDPTDDQKRFVLDLIAGKLEAVRLVLRPSRDIALEQPDFDRYWSGTLDATVPLRSSPSGR